MKRGDIILIAVLLITVAICFLFKGSASSATVYVDGKIYKELSLSEPCEFSVNNVTVKVENGTVAFVDSDCKDKKCVKSGRLSKNGETAACLPNRVVIVLSGGTQSFDGITG